ncbi:MAG: acyl-CoA dehydrogenase family protein [Nitrospira sp.]|nr:acyl-CoA dehydrogenase family protein [Nitrospira sp.]
MDGDPFPLHGERKTIDGQRSTEMDFDFTDEQRLVRETVRRFADQEIAPVAAENDRTGRFPRELLNRMAVMGFLGGPIPKEYGGSGLDYIGHAILTEEVGRADSSLRTTLSVQVSLVELTLMRWGTEEQKRRYLPELCGGRMLGCFGLTEPNAGSDPAGMETMAVKQGAGWVLNGTKTWISNGTVADLALVFAQTDPSKAHDGITAFLVEKGTPGFPAQAIAGKLGLRASDTGELILENCSVPETALLGSAGQGFKVAMSALDNGRYSVAAGCVGIIQGCLDACTEYAKMRRQFGRSIGSFQLVQDMIARMAVDLDAARLLVFRAGHLKNQGILNSFETSIAKYFASEAAVRAATDAVQIFGAYGYSEETPVARYYRDAKVATIYEGTSQIQKLLIGSHLLGIKAFT